MGNSASQELPRIPFLSKARCEGAKSVTDPAGEGPVGAEIADVQPGKWKNVAAQFRIDVEEMSGGSVMINQPVAGSALMLQHNLSFGGPAGNMYAGVLIADTSSDGLKENLLTIIRTGSQGMLNLKANKALWSPSTELEADVVLMPSNLAALETGVTHDSGDATVALKYSQGRGRDVSMSYFQTVSPTLRAGCDTSYSFDEGKIGTKVYGVYAPTPSSAWWGSYSTSSLAVPQRKLSVQYWQDVVTNRLKMGAGLNMEGGGDGWVSGMTFAYEMPIRIEEGSFAYTTVKGEAKVGETVKITTNVEHALLHGQGKVQLGASMDHANPSDPYKFGVGLQISSM
jgi:hypothetical protein